MLVYYGSRKQNIPIKGIKHPHYLYLLLLALYIIRDNHECYNVIQRLVPFIHCIMIVIAWSTVWCRASNTGTSVLHANYSLSADKHRERTCTRIVYLCINSLFNEMLQFCAIGGTAYGRICYWNLDINPYLYRCCVNVDTSSYRV